MDGVHAHCVSADDQFMQNYAGQQISSHHKDHTYTRISWVCSVTQATLLSVDYLN